MFKLDSHHKRNGINAVEGKCVGRIGREIFNGARNTPLTRRGYD